MYQSPSVHMLSLYSYNLSLWGVGRGLEMAPSPCDDPHCLLFHLFLLWIHLLRSAYYACLQIKTSGYKVMVDLFCLKGYIYVQGKHG